MKLGKILILFLFGIVVSCTNTNPMAEQEHNQRIQKGIEQGFDINPFPGEYPTNLDRAKKNVGTSALTNWGRSLLLPDSIKARLVAECVHPVVVKIFDTGGKCSHSFLAQGQRPGSSYTGETDLEDGNGHSTHVAGIIVGNDGLGVLDALVDVGKVTWEPVKILGNTGSGSFTWVANAVTQEDIENRTLLANGTFVVCNGSFGGGTAKVAAVETALKKSTEMGVLYCFAAGNTGTLGVNYPGNSDYGIGVGSLDQSPFQRSSYSTFGPEVWNAEPGRNIYSTYKGNAFATMSGTSMATPFQTALVAIAKSKWGNQIPDLATMRKYLAWVASDLPPAGKDDNTGYGWIAVKSILDKNPKDIPGGENPPPPPPPSPEDPHVARNITFTFTGEFAMYWHIAGPGQVREVQVTRSNRAALEKLIVTKIEFRVNKSTLMAPTEYLKCKEDVQWYFTNRGLGLATGSDYADATYWSAYFFEMVLDRNRGGRNVDVLRIEGKDSRGNTVVLEHSELRHWPITN